MGGRLIDRVRVGPLGEQAQGFAADFLWQLIIDGDTDHAGGIHLAPEPEGAVDEATQHEGRPVTGVAGVEERGDRRAARLEGEVVHGTDGLVGHDGGLVVDETGGGWVEATTQGDDGGEAYRGVGILGHRVEGGGGPAHPVDGVRTGVAQHRVGVGILTQQGQHLGQVFTRTQTGGGEGGEGADAGRGVQDQLAEREVIALQRGLGERADRLGADLGVDMRQQRHEAVGGGHAVGQRRDRRGLTVEGFARGDCGAAAGEDAQAPNTMDALQRVGGLRRGLEAIGGVGTAGQLDLRPETDALVGVREQGGELGGAALSKTILHEAGDGGRRLGLPHLVGGKGDDATSVMRLPARDKVGDDQAPLPIVFHIGGRDPPDQLVGLDHLHARAGRLELEGPDAGPAGGTTVIADMEVLGLGLEVAGAGVIGQAGRAGRNVGGRRDDEGWLHRVLQFPDLLGHPAGGRTLLQADGTVEGMHGLVLHFPTGIRPLHDVDDARLVALVGVIVHGDTVAEVVKRDLLRVAQTEVHDLEIGAVGLKAEDRAAIAGVVLLTFLRGEIEAAVTDRPPDATVVADGKAVHVVAGKRNAYAEAVLQDLALPFDAVLLGILQHPDARDAGEIDVVVPRHHAGPGAIQHIVELLVEHPGLGENAVGLLVGEEADLLGLGRHPLWGALRRPLLVQGEAIGGRRCREVVVVPIEVVAVILDAEAEAMRLRDVETAVVTESDGRRRGDAGRLMPTGLLEAGAWLQGGRAFARHAYEITGGLGLGPATGRELHFLGR